MVTEAFDVGVTKGAVDDDPDENNEIDGDKLDGSPLLALDLDIHFGSNDASACVEISVLTDLLYIPAHFRHICPI